MSTRERAARIKSSRKDGMKSPVLEAVRRSHAHFATTTLNLHAWERSSSVLAFRIDVVY